MILIDKETTGITRDEFLERITRQGIGVGVQYSGLPLGPKLSDADVADVVAGVRRVVNS